MEEPITDLVEKGNESRLRAYLAKITADERLLAILVCRADGSAIFKTERAPTAVSCAAGDSAAAATRIVQLPSGSVQISRFDFDAAEPVPFRVLLLHDLSFVDRRQRTARDFVLVFVGISVLLLALLIVLVAWLQLRRWVKVLIGDIRGKRFLDDAESPPFLAAHSLAGCARCWPRRRRSSAWKSIFGRIGRRRRCARWCAIT